MYEAYSYDFTDALDYLTENDLVNPFVVGENYLTSTNHEHGSQSYYNILAIKDLVVSFDYYTSTEQGWDRLYVYLNDELVIEQSGQTESQSYSINMTSGDKLSFVYYKDGSSSEYNDCVYIENMLIELA